MREIKFRAWDKNRLEMTEVDILATKDDGGYVIVGNDYVWNKDPETGEAECLIKLSDLVLMQYAGLKDKNGKEIYEGDILNSLYRTDGCKGVYEVQWSEIRASFFAKKHGEHQQTGVSIFPSDLQSCEIIGNIYENPELINSKEEE